MQRATLASATGSRSEGAPSQTRPAAAHNQMGANLDAAKSFLSKTLSSFRALAFADQAVASATSFFSTVLVGRFTDASQLGVFAIGVSMLISALAIQEALIAQPYAILRQEGSGTPAQQAGGSLLHCLLLAVLISTLLAAGAKVFFSSPGDAALAAMLQGLAIAMPFALLREFGRRYAFAHLNLALALKLDASVAMAQLSLIGALGWSGRLSPATAFLALGAGCGAPALLWLWRSRAQFAFFGQELRASLKNKLNLGKWLLAGQLSVQVQSYVPYWLSMAILGAAPTGVLAACMSVVSAVNPFLMGMGNLLTPRAVAAWQSGGGAQLRAQARSDALLLGSIAGSFVLLTIFAGDYVVALLYRGENFGAPGQLVALLALALMVSAIGAPAANGLAAMQHAHAVVKTSFIGAAASALAIAALVPVWGLVGAAAGWLFGGAVGSLMRWRVFLTLTR